MPHALAALEQVVAMLDSLNIGCCIFDRHNRVVRWNHAMLVFFPEHAGHIHVGEHYRDNLNRFYSQRLSAEEMPQLGQYVEAGIERHESQQRPFTFFHRGVWLRVASRSLPNRGRMRIWTRVAAPASGGPPDDNDEDTLAMLFGVQPVASAAADTGDVLEYLADGFMAVDAQGRITSVNAQFLDLYGFPDRASVAGLRLEDVFRLAWQGREHLEARHYEFGASIFAENLRFSGAPFVLPLPDGRWVRVIEQQGRAGLNYFSHVDITAIKRQQMASEESVRFKSRFLATASHDLRQPVHALGLMAEMLDPDAPREDIANRFDAIRSCISTLTDMLNELLDLSSFDMGIHHVAPTTVSMAGLLRETRDMFLADASRKGLQLVVDDGGLFVHSDKHLLRRIVFNLVSNAVKYTARGSVSIVCARHGQQVWLTVRDTGIGIAPDRLNFIFDDNIRLRPTQELNEGLGIGLTVVRLATDLLQHGIRVHSQPGFGTTFVLELPVRDPADEPAGSDVQAAPASLLPPAPPCVVLIEDDSYALQSMAELLTSWGYRVLPCLSPDDALAAVKTGSQSPDLVMSDMHLNAPLDGLGVISALRACQPGRPLPAILLTGDLSEQVSNDAAAAGVRIVFKPIRPLALRELIASGLA
ncbi:MAG: PAS-domain containing protein [Polaromonas sp.]|nr:PAS-domain containing protein [Polaromonas sp.]